MLKTHLYKKGAVLGIILLFIFGCCMPGHTGTSILKRNQPSSLTEGTDEAAGETVVTCIAFGKTRDNKQNVILAQDDATMIFKMLRELKSSMTQYPFSEKTQSLKIAFIDLLDEKGLTPNGVSKETYLSLLNPRWAERLQKTRDIAALPQPFANRGTCALCSVGGEGSGVLIPLFLLPRPRIAMLWLGTGLTTAANLLTSKGYVAGGAQTGFTFGFMGIGLSYALPGYTLYGFIGYALLTSTTAEYVEHYPPNRAPTISDVLPADGGQNIPLSLSELQFRIQDADGDLMSYTITTDPDIGSASGNLKPFGVYTIPVSGLQDMTKYTWHIQVTDGKDTAEETLTFTTEAIAPIISNPSPVDTQQAVPPTLTDLQFTLTDFQGDLLDYTVETAPDIGSGSGSHVHNGSYTVPVADLTIATAYKWYVNVTDGAHWTRKIFTFETTYPEEFNPFDYGWLYRKQITIDHTKVVGDLVNFPVLLSIIDSDLQDTAQDDGDDILFMPTGGVAHKLNHEIESYDSSTGTLVAWVNITSLSSTTDTVFYMYYGHPDCLSKENVKQTWDANYKAVFHMKDLTTSTIVDSTINAITGTKTGANEPIQATSGKIGNAQSFDNYDDRINIGDISSNNITISAWTKCAGSSVNEMVVNKGYTSASPPYYQYGLYISQTTGYVSMWVTTGGSIYGVSNTATDVNNNNWNYLVVRYDGDTCYASADGGTEQTDTAPSGNINAYSTNAYIGDYTHYTGSSGFNGLIDEVRISNIARSPSWISTEYNNQNNPSGFMIFGPEEPGP